MLYVMAGLLIIKDSISIRNLLVIQIIGKIYLVYWFKLGICFIEYYSEVFKIHNLHYFSASVLCGSSKERIRVVCAGDIDLSTFNAKDALRYSGVDPFLP